MDLRSVLMAFAVLALGVPAAHAQGGAADARKENRIQLPAIGSATMIGVRLDEVTAENMKAYNLSKPEGAIVASVRPDTPAAAAGIQEKDLIIQFDGERVRSSAHLARLVQETPAGREVPMTVVRGGQNVAMRIKPVAASGWFDPRFHDLIEDVKRGIGDSAAGRGRGRLGASVQGLNSELAEYFGVKSGVLVTSVGEGTAASKSGLTAGDVITAVNGTSVASVSELAAAFAKSGSTQEVTLTVMRNRKEMTLRAAPQN